MIAGAAVREQIINADRRIQEMAESRDLGEYIGTLEIRQRGIREGLRWALSVVEQDEEAERIRDREEYRKSLTSWAGIKPHPDAQTTEATE